MVDLQRGCPIDVLEERTAATVATWLHAHPNVTIVARDRAEAYTAGMRQGAPEATQVADRLHLLKNVAAALHAVFNGHHREMDQLNHLPHNEPATHDVDAVTLSPDPPVTMHKAQQQITHNRAQRVTAYAQARALHQQGGTMHAISTHLGRHQRTIKTDLERSTFPERPPRRQPPSSLEPDKTDRRERWQAGYRSAKELYHAIQAPGLPGKSSMVAAYVSRLRPPQGRITRRRKSGSPAPSVAVDKPLTPSRATWLIMRREATRTEDAKHPRARLQAQEGEIAEAIALTQDFAALVRQRQPDQLATWLARATASGLQAFKRCATGLRAAYEAVKAGVPLLWRTGPVAGQMRRLKMLKRQMYGRAGIGLLRQRVLLRT
jgi:transposase